jgi:hypothetical protein
VEAGNIHPLTDLKQLKPVQTQSSFDSPLSFQKHIYIGEGYLAQSRHQQQQQQQVAPNLTLHRLPLPIRLVVLVRNEPEHDKTNKQTKKIHSSDVLSLSLSPRPING